MISTLQIEKGELMKSVEIMKKENSPLKRKLADMYLDLQSKTKEVTVAYSKLSDFQKQIEKEVDDELERERRAEDGYDDEDDYYDEDNGSKVEARGNKSAQESKNEPRDKTQKQSDNDRKPAADQRKKKASKFDESDDEKKGGARDPYSKPSRGGGKQVNQDNKPKQKMNLDDDDDFPTL